jgi:CubicO group peptidase (beta-lactamase class C family)
MKRHLIVFRAAVILHAAPVVPLLAQGLPRARPEEVGLSSAALDRIAPALQTFIDSGRLAGIAAAVARHGKLVYFSAVGTMDSARTVPMKPDAVFRIYSMTKPVTTVAVMQLYERGKIKLDDPVSKYIPEFANTQVYDGGPSPNPTLRAPDRPITIEHLLTHTSGLTYGAFGNSPVDSMYGRAGILGANQTIETMAANVAKLPLLFSPGTKWNYSVALDVLGRVVEVASGMTFDRYLQDEIFTPLAMTHTSFHATAAMDGSITWLFAPAGAGRLRANPQLLSAGYRDQGKAFMGGQGLLSTIPDYMRFAQMLLSGGELDGKRVLKRETVTMMMQNHLPAALTPIPMIAGYGFGFGGAVRVDSGGRTPEPRGTFRWSGFASTFFWIDPKNELIGMVWAQLIPTFGPLDQAFQRVVYEAVTAR